MSIFKTNLWWTCGLWVCLFGQTLAYAQESADDPTQSERKTPPLPEVQPEPRARTPLYYLPDERGKLLMVPGFTLKDFDRVFLQEQASVKAPEPKVVLEKVLYRAVAGEDRAELAATLQLTTTSAQWLNVPLRFPGCVLLDAELDKEAKLLIEYQQQGYACWLRPQQDQTTTHELKLRLLVPLETVGEAISLRINGPRTSRASLELQVPLAKATLEASRLVKVSEVDHALTNSTTFTISALPNDALLKWQNEQKPPEISPAVLQVAGAVYVEVDGQSVRSEAELTLKSFQEPFQSFRLKLPEESKLVGPVRIRGLNAETSFRSETVVTGPPTVLEIQFSEPVAGPITVTCNTLRLPKEDRKESPVQFLGFEILGAGQQSGYVAFNILGNWQLAWEPRRNVEQVELEELPDTLRSRRVELGYQYYNQPASLPARIVRRQPSVAVEPNYSFVVREDELLLNARLKYSVRRASVRQLEIVLPPDWELELGGVQTSPTDLIDQERFVEDETRPLIIPFQEQQLGEFELLLQARRTLAAKELLKLTLPAPVANRLGPAVVEVQPANNIRLNVVEEQLIGLSEFSRPTRQGSRSQWQQSPILYRTSVATAQFVAGFEILPQKITVQAETDIRLKSNSAGIVQDWTYEVLHEPISAITLQIPHALDNAQEVELLLDGKPLGTLFSASDVANPAVLQLVSVDLEAAKIGKFNVQLRYNLPIPPTPEGATTEHVFPLVFPGDATPKQNLLAVSGMPGSRVQLRGSGWELSTRPRQASSSLDSSKVQAFCQQPQPAVHVTLDVQDTDEATKIRRAWLQTWMVDQRRRDRLCYLVTGQRNPLVVELPPGTETSSLQVLVSGKFLVPQLDRFGEQFALTVPLPEGAETNAIEINYTVAEGASELSNLIPPQASPSLHQRQTYWEIILPSHKHLLWSPNNVQQEYQWQWKYAFLGRSPVWTQQDLEQWVGVQAAPELPPAANRYLFSYWGSVEQVNVQTISRPVLVLLCSSASLIVGMALLYLPWLRHRGMLLAVGVILAAAGYWAADIAPLVVQAMLLGILLTAAAGILDRRVHRRSAQGLVVRSAGSSITSRTPVGTSKFEEEPLTQGSTATASIAVPGGGSS